MTHYLISYLIVENETKIINGGTTPFKSQLPKTISEIDKHIQKYYAGANGVAYITNVQKISETEYEEYGGNEEIN